MKKIHDTQLDNYIERGFTFFWTGSKEKKVVTPWREYMDKPPSVDMIEEWRKHPIQNWAILTGLPSGIIVVDVDTIKGADAQPFLDASKRTEEEGGQPFYTVRTQSGGYHFYFKYTPLLSKTKHKRQTKEGELLHHVDIQSDGAIVFAPPSEFVWQDGSLHSYEYLGGEIQEIPGDLLAQIIEGVSQETFKEIGRFELRNLSRKDLRPGDIYNHYASWDEILVPLGWRKIRERGETVEWVRPGKEDSSLSMTTNWKGWGLAIPFSTEIPELTPLKGYTKFSLYAHLYHGGDFNEAAKDIKDRMK